MWDGTTLTSPNGGSIALNKKAKKALEDAIRQHGNTVASPKAGDRADTPLDGGTDPAPAPTAMPAMQIWYGDPAEHPNAYIAITEETPGTVLVRDGAAETGGTLSFTREQWAALVDPDDEGLGDPEGDKENPAAVRDPDELYKTPSTGKSKQ